MDFYCTHDQAVIASIYTRMAYGSERSLEIAEQFGAFTLSTLVGVAQATGSIEHHER
jgi:hypothetical protein